MVTVTMRQPRQQAGLAAALGLFATLVGYIATLGGHPYWGFLFQAVAIGSGLFGLARAASPRHGGGLLSAIALGMGIVGVLVAVLGMVGVILF